MSLKSRKSIAPIPRVGFGFSMVGLDDFVPFIVRLPFVLEVLLLIRFRPRWSASGLWGWKELADIYMLLLAKGERLENVSPSY